MSVTWTVRKIVRQFVLIVSLLYVCGLSPLGVLAQNDTVPDRKVTEKIQPRYPAVAKKMGLSGTVRLQVVIASDGSVKETKVIGGHPILVNAAVDAVKKWKFEPARSESRSELEFKFQSE